MPTHGPLEVRYAAHADTLLERLAVEHRQRAEVVLVTSDGTVTAAAGIDVQHVSSQTFVRELPALVARGRSRPAGSPGSSTARRGRGWSGSGAASKTGPLQIGLVLLAGPCYIHLKFRVRLQAGWVEGSREKAVEIRG